MAISGFSAVTTIAPQSTNLTKAQAADTAASDNATAKSAPDTDKSSSTATSSAPAATVLTQGPGAAHGHHKKHALPGQPGHQVSKSA